MPNNTKENDKLYSGPRALSSKENKPNADPGETSFRIYYGATGAAVPFVWESQPGTPKHPIFGNSHDVNDNIAPPLTPPPSYTTPSTTLSHTSRKRRKSWIFDVIFSPMLRKNANVTPTSSMNTWSTTSSSNLSSLSSPARKNSKSHRKSVSSCSFGSRSPFFGEDEHLGAHQNSRMLCFGFKKKYKVCYSMKDMKNAILSIRGH